MHTLVVAGWLAERTILKQAYSKAVRCEFPPITSTVNHTCRRHTSTISDNNDDSKSISTSRKSGTRTDYRKGSIARVKKVVTQKSSIESLDSKVVIPRKALDITGDNGSSGRLKVVRPIDNNNNNIIPVSVRNLLTKITDLSTSVVGGHERRIATDFKLIDDKPLLEMEGYSENAPETDLFGSLKDTKVIDDVKLGSDDAGTTSQETRSTATKHLIELVKDLEYFNASGDKGSITIEELSERLQKLTESRISLRNTEYVYRLDQAIMAHYDFATITSSHMVVNALITIYGQLEEERSNIAGHYERFSEYYNSIFLEQILTPTIKSLQHMHADILNVKLGLGKASAFSFLNAIGNAISGLSERYSTVDKSSSSYEAIVHKLSLNEVMNLRHIPRIVQLIQLCIAHGIPLHVTALKRFLGCLASKSCDTEDATKYRRYAFKLFLALRLHAPKSITPRLMTDTLLATSTAAKSSKPLLYLFGDSCVEYDTFTNSRKLMNLLPLIMLDSPGMQPKAIKASPTYLFLESLSVSSRLDLKGAVEHINQRLCDIESHMKSVSGFDKENSTDFLALIYTNVVRGFIEGFAYTGRESSAVSLYQMFRQHLSAKEEGHSLSENSDNCRFSFTPLPFANTSFLQWTMRSVAATCVDHWNLRSVELIKLSKKDKSYSHVPFANKLRLTFQDAKWSNVDDAVNCFGTGKLVDGHNLDYGVIERTLQRFSSKVTRNSWLMRLAIEKFGQMTTTDCCKLLTSISPNDMEPRTFSVLLLAYRMKHAIGPSYNIDSVRELVAKYSVLGLDYVNIILWTLFEGELEQSIMYYRLMEEENARTKYTMQVIIGASYFKRIPEVSAAKLRSAPLPNYTPEQLREIIGAIDVLFMQNTAMETCVNALIADIERCRLSWKKNDASEPSPDVALCEYLMLIVQRKCMGPYIRFVRTKLHSLVPSAQLPAAVRKESDHLDSKQLHKLGSKLVAMAFSVANEALNGDDASSLSSEKRGPAAVAEQDLVSFFIEHYGGRGKMLAMRQLELTVRALGTVSMGGEDVVGLVKIAIRRMERFVAVVASSDRGTGNTVGGVLGPRTATACRAMLVQTRELVVGLHDRNVAASLALEVVTFVDRTSGGRARTELLRAVRELESLTISH